MQLGTHLVAFRFSSKVTKTESLSLARAVDLLHTCPSWPEADPADALALAAIVQSGCGKSHLENTLACTVNKARAPRRDNGRLRIHCVDSGMWTVLTFEPSAKGYQSTSTHSFFHVEHRESHPKLRRHPFKRIKLVVVSLISSPDSLMNSHATWLHSSTASWCVMKRSHFGSSKDVCARAL